MTQAHCTTVQNQERREVSRFCFFLLMLLGFLPMGCSVAVSGGGNSTVAREQAALATGAVPAQFFGMVVKGPGTPTVSSGGRRLWDCGVSWAALEPEAGVFQWATLDAEVASAEAAGAEVTLTLGMTPSWASAVPGAPSVYGAGATAMPARIADWDAYAAAVAVRYRGRIHGYEVWNAPENPTYFADAPTRVPADMALLAQHAAEAVHGADPAAVVVSPAMSSQGLAAFVAAGGGAAVDVIGSALNGSGYTAGTGVSGAPEGMAATLEAIRGVTAGTSAAGKPVWNAQSAWVLSTGGVDKATQANYVARTLLLNAGLGVERLYWYAWDDRDGSVLPLSDGQGQPTAAGAAYAVVEGWLAGAQMNGCAATAGGLWTCQLVRGASTEWVLWSAAGTVSASALGKAQVTDLSGQTAAVGAGGTVEVSGSPVLLQ